MKIAAFDLSLTCSGWARYGSTTAREYGTLSPPRALGLGLLRLQWLHDAVLDHARPCDLVVIEGYSYGSKGRAVINIGELGGVVRLALYEQQVPFVVVPPSSLKKLATGKGNSGKELVLVEAVKRLEYEGADNNEADALWLLEAAKQHYKLPGATNLPKTHTVAISVVQWPHLDTE